MKIFSIELKNFRQYRGEKKIDFSTDIKKPFTIIQGSNGAGKTNLMNAITWCLYGKEEHLSKLFHEKTIDPFNKQELEDTPTDKLLEMKVKIKIGEDGPKYIIQRIRKVYKLADNQYSYSEKDDFQVLWLDGKDWKKVISQPTYFVNMLLPQTIHDFFFFDGEKLDDFFKADSNKRVRDAIFKVSGIELLDSAIEHLDSVRDDIRRNTKGHSSDAADAIFKKIETLKKELINKKEDLSEFIKQESDTLNRIREIDAKIRDSPSEKIKDLQKDRQELNDNIEKLQTNLNKIKEDSISHLIETAPYIYACDAIVLSSKIIDEKYKKGDLPPKIREPFLKELLGSGECICGTDISHAGPQRSKVERLLQIALFSKVDQQVAEGKFTISSMLLKVKQFISERNKFGMSIKEIEDEILDKQKKIKEISIQIGTTDVEGIARLESNRNTLDSTRSELLEKIGGLKSDIERIGDWIKTSETDYDKEMKKSKVYSRLMGQITLSEKAIGTLKSIKQGLVDEMRTTIESKTKQYFLSLIWKKDTFVDIKIDQNYNISVIHKGGWDALSVLSAGERQVLALSFMAALRDASKIDAPVVIDTPLGRISGEPKENIAELLPKYLKNIQVTLLATDQEYTVPVRTKLAEWVGKEYRLEYDENRDETTVRQYDTR